MRANQSAGRFACCDCGRDGACSDSGSSLVSCASGPSGCMDGAVEVMSDSFRSLPNDDVDGGSDERLGTLDEVNGEGLRVRRRRL